MTAKTGIGQDSHAFEETPGKPLILAGIKLDHPIGLKGNSDADVVLHSITNAISSITGSNILGFGKLEIDGVPQPYANRVISFFRANEFNTAGFSIKTFIPFSKKYTACS